MPAQQPAPQANTAARPARAPALAGAGLSSVGVLTIALTGAPWPMVLTLALAGLIVVLIQSVVQGFLPQDSQHRLAWWRHYWQHRAASRRNRPDTPETPPPAL
ncbi:hypothetical protein ACFUTV_40825 [Streptomyces sp. NPDC057298]|uniref:hypothetical protein n=1 Tax=Streptomyces sp. NPDC057298 TaxID=3346091 RepID=UPI00362EA1C9